MEKSGPGRRAVLVGGIAAAGIGGRLNAFAPGRPALPDWRSGFDDQLARDSAPRSIVPPAASGLHGAVACTGGAAPAHIALAVLKAGGSAADAAIAGALANITLAAGSYISFAGFMMGMHFDARSGAVESLDGQYDIPRDETDPETIPGLLTGPPSGRTALVPGCMPGLEALHRRYGRLPWASLIEPAISLAEEGFILPPALAGRIADRAPQLSRLPDTRAIFFRPDGKPYAAGDLFRQTALATTLRGVARDGAAYMQSGDWAQHMIAAVRREGGRMTLADLRDYRPKWQPPLMMDYGAYQFAASPRPNIGGLGMATMLNLLDAAKLRETGDPRRSPTSLYNLLRVRRAIDAFGIFSGDPLWFGVDPATYLPGIDLSDAGLIDKENGKRLWAALDSPGYRKLLDVQDDPDFPGGGHTASITVVDRAGNVAAVTHTINTINWGNTTIFVDGVSIPDSASFQQVMMKRMLKQHGPGARVPTQVAVFMALKGGRPVMAASSIGQIFEVSLQSTVNMLDFGMDPQQAIEAGQFVVFQPMKTPDNGIAAGAKSISIKEVAMSWGGGPPVAIVQQGTFPPDVLAAVRRMGQPIEEGGREHASGLAAIMIDPAGRRSAGASISYADGATAAY